jgi:hypothetical protein
MIEDQPIDEPMNESDNQSSPDTYGDRSSGDLSPADVAVAENANQATTDAARTETTAPPEESPEPEPEPEPESPTPAEAAEEPARPAQTNDESSTPLFAAGPAESFRSRWLDIQTSFVDEPGRAVEQADSLVAEVMQQLAKTFADERSKLEPQLVQGEDISTEDLRMALRRYRSFFDRLLSI